MQQECWHRKVPLEACANCFVNTQVPMDTVQIAIRAFLFWILTDANPVQVLCHSWTPLWDVHRSPRCFEALSPVHIAGTCSKKTSVTCRSGGHPRTHSGVTSTHKHNFASFFPPRVTRAHITWDRVGWG